MAVTLPESARVFSDEAAAYEYLESKRWPDGPVCPHCQSKDARYVEPKGGTGTRTVEHRGRAKKTTTYRRIYTCGACRKQYSVLVDTILSDSKIPVHKWLMAIHLMCSGKNGVSVHELHRQLTITVKSAWFMAHRIRYAMEMPSIFDKLQASWKPLKPTSGARRRATGTSGRRGRVRARQWPTGLQHGRRVFQSARAEHRWHPSPRQ